LELSEVAEIGITPQEFERTRLEKDDVLFVEGNGSLDQIGRVALWDASIPGCVHQNHLIKFRAHCLVLPAFVLYQMMSPQGRAQLVEKATSSAGLNTLSISKISDVNLPVPALAEQREIVRRVEQLFTLADQIEARYAKAQAHVDKLTQSLLAKAFRGELVPQDPNDEPASALLARIRSETNGAKKPTRRKPRADARKAASELSTG
jgi:type I restriction enzyme S subunit